MKTLICQSNDYIDMKEEWRQGLEHIEMLWETLTCFVPKGEGIRIGLPNPFISPSATTAFAGDQFYWDSYFTVLGLVVCGREDIAKGMVDNLAFMCEQFGRVPMRNRTFNTGTSQPPFLTQMAKEVYDATGDDAFFDRVMAVAQREITEYWYESEKPDKHRVEGPLCRYCDHYVTHATAEHESGWDMTSRFADRCMDFLPVDLNSLLFRYEKDLSEWHEMRGRGDEAERWHERSNIRRQAMQRMWNDEKGFFYDYDTKVEQRSDFHSLAGFYPLWAGVATKEQARRCLDALEWFETDHGLATTQTSGLNPEFRQWDHPNGWAPLHWIVFDGLRRYCYEEDAARIGIKWLDLNAAVLKETGELWEKYDVAQGTKGVSGRYQTQPGFGWTNAVFARMVCALTNERIVAVTSRLSQHV